MSKRCPSHHYRAIAQKRPLRALFATCLLGVLMNAMPLRAVEGLDRGDQAFNNRAADSPGAGMASTKNIDLAIAAYEEALKQQPDDLERRIRLLRAIFFKGEYVPAERDERRILFERGHEIFDQGLTALEVKYQFRSLMNKGQSKEAAALLKGEPLAGSYFFWGAVHWGLWGQYFGKMASIRRGVAKKIRVLGEIALELDPDTDQSGPLRLLGRLHTIAPRVPFFTYWINRGTGTALLERGVKIVPADPLNRFFLAEALLDHHDGQSTRALDLLCAIENESPRKQRLIEDQKAIEDAKVRLDVERQKLRSAGESDPCPGSL